MLVFVLSLSLGKMMLLPDKTLHNFRASKSADQRVCSKNCDLLGQVMPHAVNLSAADVKMEIPVLVQSLRSCILISTSFKMDDTFCKVVSASIEQSRRTVNMVSQGNGKFSL